MILGIDHLALNIVDVEKEKVLLEQQGFKVIFQEKNVINSPAKKQLLDNFEPDHSLLYLQPTDKKGVAIEITRHSKKLNNKLCSYSYHNNYIELLTPCLDAEIQFWQVALSFECHADYELQFNSIIPGWSGKVILKEQQDMQPNMLDSEGYTCLTLISNNISTDMEVIKHSGATDITPLFKSMINGKKLAIIMFRTPGGAIVELIQIQSKND